MGSPPYEVNGSWYFKYRNKVWGPYSSQEEADDRLDQLIDQDLNGGCRTGNCEQ